MALDKSTEDATVILLRLELDELKVEDFDMALTGFGADQLLEIMAGRETISEGQTDNDAVPEAPETSLSQPADVWMQDWAPMKCTRQCA